MKITIDGKEFSCKPGQKVYDVAEENDIYIPTLCLNKLNHEERPAGCRICLVELVGQGNAEPKLESSCSLPVHDGMEISTKNKVVYDERREVLELLLSEHEQDCRNCGISGDCYFADLCFEYDIDGVSVCSECPNRKDGCFLARDILCLGPVTHAGCNAFCTRNGDPCESCFGVLSNKDVLVFGLEAFGENGFTRDQVLEAAKVFSYEEVRVLEELMDEYDLLNKEVSE